MHNRLLYKAARVLEAIAEHQSLGLEELHLLLDLPKPTLKRLLDDFEELGWLYRRLGDKRYVVLGGIEGLCDARYRMAKIASPFLDELFKATGLASDLVIATLHGPTILESNFSRLSIRIGRDRIIGAHPCPCQAASGRALVAHSLPVASELLHSSEVDDEFLRTLEDERQTGYFRRIPGSWEYGFCRPFDIDAIAIPLTVGEQAVVSLNLYWDVRRLAFRFVETHYLPQLKATGQRLTTALEMYVATLVALSTGELANP